MLIIMFNYLGLRADKAIIDFRDPMRGIAKIITAASRYPENARITDDRSYGIVDRRIIYIIFAVHKFEY